MRNNIKPEPESALTNIISAAVILVLVGFVAWVYLIFGRFFIGLDGNLEIAVVGIGLWAVHHRLIAAADKLVGPIDRQLKKIFG